MLTEVFYILFFYALGEFVSYLIDGFIPGSVIGMVVLFLALALYRSVSFANVSTHRVPMNAFLLLHCFPIIPENPFQVVIPPAPF